MALYCTPQHSAAFCCALLRSAAFGCILSHSVTFCYILQRFCCILMRFCCILFYFNSFCCVSSASLLHSTAFCCVLLDSTSSCCVSAAIYSLQFPHNTPSTSPFFLIMAQHWISRTFNTSSSQPLMSTYLLLAFSSLLLL
jgi:hypothetical protein